MAEDENDPAAPLRSPADELPWQRARRERLAQIEAEQAHGEQLLQRYGRTDDRPRFANVGRVSAKRRRR